MRTHFVYRYCYYQAVKKVMLVPFCDCLWTRITQEVAILVIFFGGGTGMHD